MNNEISVLQQTLHGYNCGHHMLASSVKLGERSIRKMEKMSDLTGNVVEKEFQYNYTGYLLEDEGYYVIAKTWYAPEMDRPGCVWTHSILIKKEELSQWANCIMSLSDIFVKPYDNKFDYYMNEVKVSITKDRSDNFREEKIKYILWGIFGHKFPVVVPTNDVDEYFSELLYIVFSQYSHIKKNFSFSIGASAIRHYEKDFLDLQLIKKNNIGLFVSQNSIGVLEECEKISRYPLWIDVFYEMIKSNALNKILEFRDEFPIKYRDTRYFSMFIKLYLALNIDKEEFKIIDGLIVIEALGDDKALLTNALVDLYFKYYKKFEVNYIQLLRLGVNLEWIEYTDETYDFFVAKSMERQKEQLFTFVKELVNLEDNNRANRILRFYVSRVTEETFCDFTAMDLNVSSMFVALEPKLALCTCIWKQDREFQLYMLENMKGIKISYSLKKKIIKKIFMNSIEDLCYIAYSSLGKQSMKEILLEACKLGSTFIYARKSLIEIVNENEQESFSFLCLQKKNNRFKDPFCFVELFNPYTLRLNYEEADFIIQIFIEVISQKWYRERMEWFVIFYLVLMLRSEYRFPDEIFSYCFTRIYKELEDGSFSSEEWNKMEYLMPQFGEHNWDKCKRLIKAFYKKGYFNDDVKDELAIYLL